MIIDSDGSSCQVANFLIGTSTTTTRSWNIRVTQYACGQEDSSGPPGCLQYYDQTQNIIQNYNWPTSYSSTTTVSPGNQHLENQDYDICIRRASGYCYICYSAAISGIDAMNTFSLSQAGAAKGVRIDTACTTDYIEIPFGTTKTQAAITTGADFIESMQGGRFCGYRFGLDAGTTTPSTVCSKHTPFRVGVHFDSYEDHAGGAVITSEIHTAPTGTVGFRLTYWQVSC